MNTKVCYAYDAVESGRNTYDLSLWILHAFKEKDTTQLKKWVSSCKEDQMHFLCEKSLFEAMENNEDLFVMARGLQCMLPGTPVVCEDVLPENSAQKARLEKVFALRDTHVAFAGTMSFLDFPNAFIGIRWEKDGEFCQFLCNVELPLWGIHYSVNGEETILK